MTSSSGLFWKMRKKTFYRPFKRVAAGLLALVSLALCGCVVNTSAVLRPQDTLPPAATPAPAPTPTPAATPGAAPVESAAPIAGVDTMYDALGEFVSGAAHFQRYLTFEGIQVYEQAEDTFLDAMVVNAYPETLVCAVDVVFYDEEGGELATARLQTRDGQYALHLGPGKTVLFAQIDSDVTLTDKKFDLVFNDTLGVLPG